jgi:uncharacterized membrane protein
MSDLGKLLIILGLVLVAAGVLITFMDRMSFPLGRLPGDIVHRGKRTTVYFPLVTSLVVSLVLSILFYLLGRWRR